MQVPSEVVEVLRGGVPRVGELVIRAIRAEVPEYGGALEGEFGRTMRWGVEQALRRFLDLVQGSEHDPLGPSREIYYELGRVEFRQRRTLDALLGAYRVGGLVAWQEIVPACERAGVEPGTTCRLAEALFAYVHELSAVSAEGYSAERAAATGAARATRQELVELLTVRAGEDPRAAQAAADRAGWSLPERFAALVTPAGDPDRLAARIAPDAIGARIAGQACVLIADPDCPGRAKRIALALRGSDAALGPTVSVEDATRSWGWARRALELIESGAIRERGLVRADAHVATMLVHENHALAAALAARWLAPLQELSARAGHELPETLLAWLAHHGNVARSAQDLHVHPKTVRYRLEKLRRQYGTVLDDPDARFELELALRAAGIARTPPFSAVPDGRDSAKPSLGLEVAGRSNGRTAAHDRGHKQRRAALALVRPEVHGRPGGH